VTELPKPRLSLRDRLRLPANVVDVTERSVGTITAVVEYVSPVGASDTQSPRRQLGERCSGL
jgi:hypothetical protein